MRSFPRTVGRRVTVALVVAALVGGATTVPLALVRDDLDDKQKKVERKIDHAEGELEHSSKEFRRATRRLQRAEGRLDRARGNLASVQGRLTVAEARDERMQARLEAAVAKLEKARQELRQGRQDMRSKKRDVADMVSEIYAQGDPELLGLASVLDAEDPADVTRRMQATDVVVGEATHEFDELRATEVLLTVRRDQVEEAKDEVQVQREEAAAHLATMEDLERKARRATQRVQRMVASHDEARAEADRALQRDQAELRKLEAEEQRIQRMLRRRAEAARRAEARRQAASRSNSGSGGGGGSASSGGSGGSGGGAFLGWPVDGYITSHFGMRTHPIYGYRSLHDGTDFGTGGCGAPIRAAQSGQVVSRYYQSAYGNRLIIDHGYAQGKGVATIYNHASRYVVGAGQRVSKGQVIGYIGTTGWSTGCHLHFTVTANGSPVNPMNWL